MSSPEHIFLYIFLITTFVVYGVKFYDISDPLKFWISTVFPIILYSLIVGSRYGWGADYLWYKDKFEKPVLALEDEIGFQMLNNFIRFLGFGYVGAYVFYAFLLVLSLFILLRQYGLLSKYMYAFFIPATLEFTTNIIRQGIGFSVIFLFIFFLNKKKWLLCLLCFFVGISIHVITALPLIVITAMYLLKFNAFNWKITIPIYLFVALLFDVSNISMMSSLLGELNIGNKYDNYINESDKWFGEDAINDIYTQTIFASMFMMIFHVSYLYVGYLALKLHNYKNIIYIFNVSVIGLIFYKLFFNIEILRRFVFPMYMLFFIPLGFAVLVFLNSKVLSGHIKKVGILVTKSKYIYFKIGIYTIVIYLIMYWSRFVFFNKYSLFFWDA